MPVSASGVDGVLSPIQVVGSTQSGTLEHALAPMATVRTAAKRKSFDLMPLTPALADKTYTGPSGPFQAKPGAELSEIL